MQRTVGVENLERRGKLKHLTTSHEVSTSCSGKESSLRPNTAFSVLVERLEKHQLLTTNHEVNTSYSVRESSLHPNTDRTISFTGDARQRCGTEGLKCLKEHASLDGKERLMFNLEAKAQRIDEPPTPHDTPCVARHAMCPGVISSNASTFRAVVQRPGVSRCARTVWQVT